MLVTKEDNETLEMKYMTLLKDKKLDDKWSESSDTVSLNENNSSNSDTIRGKVQCRYFNNRKPYSKFSK